MKKIVIFLLILSLVFLTLISIDSRHFLALYYVVWILGVGIYLRKNEAVFLEKLSSWKLGGFKKFLLLGVCMILLEETLAGISMHLASSRDVLFLIKGVLQFWVFNLLALPGFIIAWYILLSRYVYTKRQTLILVGIFGLFAESVYSKIVFNPIAGAILILPTMFTYMIIITPSLLSFVAGKERKTASVGVRYLLGFIVPIIITLPFIGVLVLLRSHFPDFFPPEGFVG